MSNLRNNRHWRWILVLIAVHFAAVALQAQTINYFKLSNEEIFNLLDAAIDDFGRYRTEKENRINNLKDYCAKALSDEDRYVWQKSIFDEYLVYDSDSALLYIDKVYGTASKLNQEEKMILALIDKAIAMTRVGLLQEAYNVMDQINIDDAPRAIWYKYYEGRLNLIAGEELYTRRDTRVYYDNNQDLTGLIYAMRDSIIKYMPADDSYALVMKSWSEVEIEGADMEADIRAELKKLADLNFTESSVASELFSVACTIKGKVPDELYIKLLALSALSSAYSGQLMNEQTIFEDLALTIQDSNIERAYKYVNFTYHNAIAYHARAKALYLSNVHNLISDKYTLHNRRIAKQKDTYFIMVGAMTVLLLLALVFIYMQNRKLSKRRQTLHDAHQRLSQSFEEIKDMHQELVEASDLQKQLNNQLEETNQKLTESNYVKEQYLGYAFTVCSQYITKLESYRKSVNRCVKDNNQKELKKMVSLPILEQTELKDFYNSFDQVFLTIYPDFVNELNQLLNEDSRIELRDPMQLTSEVRVFALMRLGITDIEKMAEFLHCSVQTIYNNRQKMYGRTAMDKRIFKETVLSLGTATMRSIGILG